MAGNLTHIKDYWQQEVLPSILEQYSESSNWKSCLKLVIDKLQVIEDATLELAGLINLSSQPTGKHLDWVGSLINFNRLLGESDEDFFLRIITGGNAATPDGVISKSRLLSATENITDVHYLEDADCTFIVYTPQGKQLAREKVKKLAGAGILGLPGSAITLADGSFLGTTDGKRILAVANDGDIEDIDYIEVKALVFAKEGV